MQSTQRSRHVVYVCGCMCLHVSMQSRACALLVADFGWLLHAVSCVVCHVRMVYSSYGLSSSACVSLFVHMRTGFHLCQHQYSANACPYCLLSLFSLFPPSPLCLNLNYPVVYLHTCVHTHALPMLGSLLQNITLMHTVLMTYQRPQ